MSWRASPYFDQQFRVVTMAGDLRAESSFVSDVGDASDDHSLLVYADWLEEQGDSRAQYIRDMCELSEAQRPCEKLWDRINQFEAEHAPGEPLLFRTLPIGTIVVFRQLKHMISPEVDFREVFQDASQVHWVLDLRLLRMTGSEFLGHLVKAAVDRQRAGQHVPIVMAKGNILEVCRIVHLDKVFPVCEDFESVFKEIEAR